MPSEGMPAQRRAMPSAGIQAEAGVDDVFGKFDDFLGAHGHFMRIQLLLHAQLLGEKAVHAVGEDDDVGGEFILTGDDALRACRLPS